MRMLALLIALSGLALLSALADPPSAEEIRALIDRMGARDYKTRTAAAEKLRAIGKPALAALRKAAETTDDPEVRQRARQLISLIDPPFDYAKWDRKAIIGAELGAGAVMPPAPGPGGPAVPGPGVLVLEEMGFSYEIDGKTLTLKEKGRVDVIGRKGTGFALSIRPDAKTAARAFAFADAAAFQKALPKLYASWRVFADDGEEGLMMAGGIPAELEPQHGMMAEEASEALRAHLGLTDGVLVWEVEGGLAARAGLQALDLVLAVGKTKVAGPRQLYEALSKATGKTTLSILRRGKKQTLTVELPAAK